MRFHSFTPPLLKAVSFAFAALLVLFISLPLLSVAASVVT